MKNSIKGRLVIHPLFFGAFPVLFLYAQNADEARVADVFVPLLWCGGGALALCLVLGLVLRNFRKAGIIATATTFLFLSFGHFVRALPEFEYKMSESVLGPNLLILIASFVLLFVIVRSTLKTHRTLATLTSYLNLIGLGLVLLEVLHGGAALAMRKDAGEGRHLILSQAAGTERKPDIYYIVMDGYGRSDMLRRLFEYDNSEFIAKLREMGFFVADSGYTNYPQTLLSLGSTLNLDYVENIGEFPRSSADRNPLAEKVAENRVMKFLSSQGYTTVGFRTAYGGTDLKTFDRRFSMSWSTNEFESMLVSTTPVPIFAPSNRSPFATHRKRISYVLDKLSELSDVTSPKFVFAHIVCPHPPFVFDADGDAIETDKPWTVADGSHLVTDSAGAVEYKRLYRGQITYITKRLLKTVTKLIDKTRDNPPVIILQADHGPGSELLWGNWVKSNLRERFGILNAYYLPGLPGNVLYHEITPVNTFRVVLNQYFGTGLKLLEDRHEFATWYKPLAFHSVSKALGGSAYANLMRQYSSMPPDTTTLEALSERLRYGDRYFDDRNNTITERGLLIDLGSVRHTGKYEISVDYNDTYQLQYRNNGTVIASDTIPPQKREGGEICVVDVTVPSQARQRGFNEILITPVHGDGAYSVGHIVPL